MHQPPESVKTAYSRYTQLLIEFMSGQRIRGEHEYEKARFGAIADVCHAYAASENRQVFPKAVAYELAGLLQDLLSGTMPADLYAARPGKKPSLAGRKRALVASGVRFVNAVHCGLLDDPSPIKLVAACFGVSESTVRTWCKDLAMDKAASAANYNPSWCLLESQRVLMIEGLMRGDGHHYSTQFGARPSSKAKRKRVPRPTKKA